MVVELKRSVLDAGKIQNFLRRFSVQIIAENDLLHFGECSQTFFKVLEVVGVDLVFA